MPSATPETSSAEAPGADVAGMPAGALGNQPGHRAALGGIRVIDLADELAAYASRLLADLGADVIRIEPPGGSAVDRAAPIVVGDGVVGDSAVGDGLVGDRDPGSQAPTLSAFDRFVNAGKRSVRLDLTDRDAQALLERLLASADLVIESPARVLTGLGLTQERLRALNPGLCQVIVTPFGLDQHQPWSPADDLVVLGAGGLLHLGGYPDVGPIAAYGGQARFAASVFAAAAAVTALLHRDATGQGAVFDVSAQECVAQALEDSAATYALTGTVRERQGDRPREAGSGVFACRDGYVSMIAGRLGTARAWTALVTWLNDENARGAEGLLTEKWNRFKYRQTPEAIEEFSAIFESFARTRDKQELYHEAQARMIALSPVSTVADLLTNEQLAFRDFFVDVPDPYAHHSLRYPRAPYRLSATPPAAPRPAPRPGQHTAAVLIGELGVGDSEYRSLVERGIV